MPRKPWLSKLAPIFFLAVFAFAAVNLEWQASALLGMFSLAAFLGSCSCHSKPDEDYHAHGGPNHRWPSF